MGQKESKNNNTLTFGIFRQKSDDRNGIGAVAEEQMADIFKLDIDCFEEIFDYLTLKDLISLSKTCKRLQQLAGCCYQQNYSNSVVWCKSEGITDRNVNDIERFAPFVQKIEIYNDGFDYFLNAQSKFQRIKQIEIRNTRLTEADMHRMKEISSKLEVLRIKKCHLDNTFREYVGICAKLRRLEISCDDRYGWHVRKYPKLEYFKFIPNFSDDFTEIPKFLELNPNIRKLATNLKNVLKFEDSIMNANIKLDELAIDIDSDERFPFDLICLLLNRLHDGEFHKRLQLSVTTLNQGRIDRLATVNGLTKLKVYLINSPVAFSELKNLEEVDLTDSSWIGDLESVANHFGNLNLVKFVRSSFEHIALFIKRTGRLQKIRISNRIGADGIYFSEDSNVIDLRALNRERELLSEAQKITLYVAERIYLATKWALTTTDFNLIRLKRNDSFKWNIYD